MSKESLKIICLNQVGCQGVVDDEKNEVIYLVSKIDRLVEGVGDTFEKVCRCPEGSEEIDGECYLITTTVRSVTEESQNNEDISATSSPDNSITDNPSNPSNSNFILTFSITSYFLILPYFLIK